MGTGFFLLSNNNIEYSLENWKLYEYNGSSLKVLSSLRLFASRQPGNQPIPAILTNK